MKTFYQKFKLQISLIQPTNNSHAYIAAQTTIETLHRLRNESEKQRESSDVRMKKWEKGDCKWSADCESECNVCGIISLIEFSKAIVLVVTLLSASASARTPNAVKLLIYENIIKCVGKCWMRCECKYLDLYHLKLCVCIYDLREVSSGSGLVFLSPFFHSNAAAAAAEVLQLY